MNNTTKETKRITYNDTNTDIQNRISNFISYDNEIWVKLKKDIEDYCNALNG